MVKRSFFLKNMVSKSCIKLIELYFSNIEGVSLNKLMLGKVDLEFDESIISVGEIISGFESLGFIEIVNPDSILVEKTKLAAIELIFMANNTNSLIRNSDYISERVQEPYSKLSKLFSVETGVTLEKYLIILKIERTKELLIEGELTLSEISYLLGYSSVQYLSTQFKKISGYSVSEFKELKDYLRIPLEHLV